MSLQRERKDCTKDALDEARAFGGVAKEVCTQRWLPEVRAVALLRGALPIERMIFVRRRLFARGINGGLQRTRATNESVRRFVQMVGESRPLFGGTGARLTKKGHPEPLHCVK